MAQISHQQDGVIDISGDLTFATVTPLCHAIPDYFANTHDLTVDLSAVKNCDSASLVLLISIIRFLDARNKIVTFTRLPKSIVTLIKLYNLQQLITIK